MEHKDWRDVLAEWAGNGPESAGEPSWRQYGPVAPLETAETRSGRRLLLREPVRAARERYAAAREALGDAHEGYAWAKESGATPERLTELRSIVDGWQRELDRAATALHMAERAANGTGGGC